MRRVGVTATAAYLPPRTLAAADVAAWSGIAEDAIVGRFGLRQKHVAGEDEHVSDMAVAAGQALLDETGVDPGSIDALVYFGSMWKDHAVWQASPHIAHRLGCTRAVAIEYDNVSCGTPVALRLCRNYLRAEPELQRILAVAASRESHLLDYANGRARFMLNFGDGAVAALVEADADRNELLGCHGVTDGSLSLQVKVPAGGSVEPIDVAVLASAPRRDRLDVVDPLAMKEVLDRVSLDRFVETAAGALERSGASLADIGFVCGLHMKRSMHEALLDALGVPAERACYLEDTGHMSGVDPLLGLDRAARAGRLGDGDLVLLLAAGTGYTWAASVVRWGPIA